MLRECSGTCHWGHCPCHYPGILGKGCCHFYSWFPKSPEEDRRAFQTLQRVVWPPQALHAEWNRVERGWDLHTVLGQNIWMTLSKSLFLFLSCLFTYQLKSLGSKTPEVLPISNTLWLWNSLQTRESSRPGMFTWLSGDSCGLCGPRLSALLRAVFKA